MRDSAGRLEHKPAGGVFVTLQRGEARHLEPYATAHRVGIEVFFVSADSVFGEVFLAGPGRHFEAFHGV